MYDVTIILRVCFRAGPYMYTCNTFISVDYYIYYYASLSRPPNWMLWEFLGWENTHRKLQHKWNETSLRVTLKPLPTQPKKRSSGSSNYACLRVAKGSSIRPDHKPECAKRLRLLSRRALLKRHSVLYLGRIVVISELPHDVLCRSTSTFELVSMATAMLLLKMRLDGHEFLLISSHVVVHWKHRNRMQMCLLVC